MRDSVRRCWPWPTMRKPQVRLSWPQASVVGAHVPAAYRLYELMVGARKIASSDACAMWPARYCLKVADSPSKALRESFQRLGGARRERRVRRLSGVGL